MDKPQSGPLFNDISAECDDGLSEIESLCLACYKQGMTRLLLTKIPFFREVIVSSFQCEHCGHTDRSIQSAGRIQEQGVQLTLTVSTPQDLNRQVVKSEYASFSIPAVELEQPSIRKGEITTVEGLVEGIVNGLEMLQDERRKVDNDTAVKIDDFILRLRALKNLERPFTIIINDPSGNSCIENPNAPHRDDHLAVSHYTRTREQDVSIGCRAEDDDDNDDAELDVIHEESADDIDSKNDDIDEFGVASSDKQLNLKNEVLRFPTNCSNCNSPCSTNMKLVDIPYFKQVVIMATVCDACGNKDNEVKGGSGIEALGTKITLLIKNSLDLNRDVLKSDTAAVLIPELDLELVEGTLGGKFTTVEGLLVAIKEQLEEKNPFISGDSGQDDTRQKIKEFCARLNKIITGEMTDVHLILDDPAGNSYMQSLHAPDVDPQLTVENYERNHDQNDLLGLNEMCTENYETTGESSNQQIKDVKDDDTAQSN